MRFRTRMTTTAAMPILRRFCWYFQIAVGRHDHREATRDRRAEQHAIPKPKPILRANG
jgi:hypothetical protein